MNDEGAFSIIPSLSVISHFPFNFSPLPFHINGAGNGIFGAGYANPAKMQDIPRGSVVTFVAQLPPDANYCQITVYNIKGRVVSRLDATPSSRVSVSWDTKDSVGKRLGSGVYWYEVKTARSCEHRKMILMR